MATQDNRDEDYQLWTLDSGSTRHITPDKTQFIQLRNLDEDIYIKFGNQTKEPALASETLQWGACVCTTVSAATSFSRTSCMCPEP